MAVFLICKKKPVGVYYIALLEMSILQQKSKFEYGYKFNGSRMERQHIMLPVLDDGTPDHKYMEKEMKKIEMRQIEQHIENRISVC